MAYHIVGSLTLTTHARQTAPDQKSGAESSTIKTSMFDSQGFRHEVPYITGNSQRGLLRRFATEIVLDPLVEKGHLVPRQIFQIMSRGADRRDGIGITPSAQAMVENSAHVFAGLFGGGPHMIQSRYSISALWPLVGWADRLLHPSLVDRVIPTERLTGRAEDGRIYDLPLTTKIILAPRDDLQAGRGKKYIESYQESVDAWLAEVSAGRAAKADAKALARDARERGEKPSSGGASGSVDTANFTLNEAMLPGMPLQYWMRFKPQATHAQIGLMLLAVRDWANANVLGGGSAQGFGRFDANLALLDGDNVVAENIFNLGDHATAYALSKSTLSFVGEAMEELDAITVDQLRRVFPYEAVTARKEKTDAKAAKKAAKKDGSVGGE